MERFLLLCVCFATFIYISYGCSMEGVTQWLTPQHVSIKDTHRGFMVNRATTDIEDINRIDYGDGLNRGPYLEILLQNSAFSVSTTDLFAQYEEYETLLSIRVTITFRCTGGSTRPLTFVFNIEDTNNHAPVFLPSDSYNFSLALPVPPSFNVTGCEYLIVRDVDLTTKRIEFWIEDNPYFEILYSRQTQPKEFGGFIRTRSVIRSTPDSLLYRISATDVDDTNDEPLTSFATVNILADNEFRLPDEPIFSEAFYKADYTEDHELVLRSDIRLRQGYDNQVIFSHEGVYAENFELVENGNQVTFRLISPLPSDITDPQIFLVVRAEREFTSGSKATVVVFLPEVLDIKFESSLYEGHIEDNVLRVPNLILRQGYENIVDIEIISEHASYFSVSRRENTVTLSMRPLPISVIQSNNILSLQVVASANRSSDASVVALEIIKDDYITPVFEQDVYNGNYDSETGLTIDPIVLTQGFDSTVVVTLGGEYASYFRKVQQGAVINLSAYIPPELWSKGSLLITVVASKPRTVGANAAVRVNLPEARELIFEELSYTGNIENNILTLQDIVLSYGYANDVTFELSGQFSSYFIATSSQNRVAINLRSNLPDNIILENSLLMLILTASGLNAVTATTHILLDIIKNDYITPVFERPLYNGNYDSDSGLVLEHIIIVQGFDNTVKLSLNGDHANLFEIKQEGEIINLTGSVPPNIWPEQYLFLTMRATKPRTVGANTAIQISLPTAREMKFYASEYIGYIANNTLSIEEIILSIGYSTDVEFDIIGEFARHFTILKRENRVSINLNGPLPENIILENDFILLTVSASGVNAISTATTVLLKILKEDTNTPIFSQNIYQGFYKDSSNVDIEEISLIQGYDSSVSFRLQGDHSQYFEIRSNNNDVIILTKTPIPEELIFNEKVLLFKVVAEKERTVGATATVSIEFPRELTEPTIMKFSKNIYLGSIKDEILEVDTIILDSGFRNGTTFILSGDFAELFELSISNNIITVGIKNSISIEEIIRNKFILLVLQAFRDRAVTVSTSVVIDVITPDHIIFPVFDKSLYNGSYTNDYGLQFDHEISLIAGFDDTVTFGLEGEYSKWFALQENGNSVSIILNASQNIPNDVIASNYHLLFTIVANKPGTIGGRSAILIALPKEQTEQEVLRFEQNNYVGHIEDRILHLAPLSLNKDTENIQVQVIGEYAAYFSIVKNFKQITIQLSGDLDVSNIDNSFIILTIEASSTGALSGFTTVILEITNTDNNIKIPIFEQAYYMGEYTTAGGLSFNHTIRLKQGFDNSISFNLEGSDSQGFMLKQEFPNNVLLLSTSEGLPQNNERSFLTFSIVANKPNSISGRSAIVIHLSDFPAAGSLRFTNDIYKGTIEEDVLSLDAITLQEGYSKDVKFYLTGDYIEYFQLSNIDGNITLDLERSLPSDMYENYNFLIFVLEARSENFRTHTTIILEIKSESRGHETALIFEETYYTGTYSEKNGLDFNSVMSLINGSDDQIKFSLQGDHSIWFGLQKQAENSVTLILTSPIPPAFLANNRKLIFVVTAERPYSIAARATIVISLTDEYTSDTILGFERNSYSGSLINNTLNLEPIILTEGFSPQVSFALQGDLSSHFTLTTDGQTVRINLLTAIPEDSVPTNRILLLELRASAPQAMPAFATIVVVVESENNVPPIEQPSFVETYYTGRYTEMDGLTFENLFSLSQGYDENVNFSLEGDNSVWFGLDRRSENSLALTLRSPIPPAVLANNQKLIFIITARKPGSVTARATIVIALTDEYTSDTVLGFERVSYSGSLNNNILNLEPIILTEGFSPQVSFVLQGDLASHFTLTTDGQTIRINLLTAIPDDSLPTNRIILLELRASAPQVIPAFATIVVVVESENNIPPIEQPSFVETYYTGRYTEQDGFTFEHLFSLSKGYDENVVFSLEGDNSVWFGLERRSENSLALILRNPIPPAVLANNQKLIFIITAKKPGSVTARATIVIALNDEYTSDTVLGFERVSYSGSLSNNILNLKPIILTEGFSPQVSFALQGDLASHFTFARDGPTVRINLLTAIPEDSIPTNRIILLELRASAPQAIPTFATIVVAVESEDNVPPIEQPSFVEAYYTGRYTEQDGLTFEHLFTLLQGYDENVVFSLEGDNSVWFGLDRYSENSLALTLRSPIPPAVLANNQKLIFIITARKPGSVTARATIVIALTDEYTSFTVLGFERVSYSGSLNNNILNLEPIILTEGFSPQVSFALQGDLASHFTLTTDRQTVRINLLAAIPDDSLPTNRIILLELQASAPQVIPAFATIVVAVESENNVPPIEQPSFVETYYTGRYTEQDGLTFEHLFSLSQGYDENVVFSVEGDNSVWFGLERRSENSLALILRNPIPPAVLANNQKLIFIISASRPGSMIARATVIIALTDEHISDTILGFERVSYSGSLSNNTLNLEPIILTEGFSPQVSFAVQGDFASYFNFATDGRIVRIILVTAIPEDALPTNRIILLELRASAPQAVPAFTTIVLAVESNNIVPPVEQLSFAEAYYTGRYTEQDGLIFEELFSLSRGYDENVLFALEGDHSMWFELERRSENSLALTLNSPIPPAVLANNRKLIFVITASRPGSMTAQATVIVALTNDSHNINEAFDNILYHGFISLDTVTHEPITLTGYKGSNIEIFGQYAEIFEARLSDQDVVVNARPSAIVPNVSYIALELQADEARTVLVLKVLDTESPDLPTVTFDSSSYVMKVAETHTGVVGRVRATSDNSEAIIYSLLIDDENLRARLSVSDDGELRLSAPVTTGDHSLQVVATTIITRVTANALIHLTVEAVIDDKGIVVPPLIILDKDEEEPHRNLVVLNQTTYQGCHFILSNIWPENQTWLYVDEYGLHTEAIDREHESIAFMTLSQIQVELILSCANDNSKIRAKRSVSSKPNVDWLGPYEYGSNKWILTDSIPYNTRRSLVNLIVNDINDNAPIFVDKENEPIAVGYPVSNLEEIILPRSLAELKATDADIEENAALVYWSEEESIAVSPTTGFVHVRNHFTLENNTRLIIQATDQKGAGLTGNLELVVKLLEKDHIAVITIRNAFLDSERQILTDLSSAVGYEIKTLRTIVISELESSRKKRETSEGSGASLQLFVYGLIEREPVEVNKLTADIQNSNIVTVNVVGSISLEDHLAGNETCVIPGRDTGLLVATIVLSVLLFILIVVIAAWFLKRKFRKSYESFSDKNSLASGNESLEPKLEIVTKPRLNIEDLKRSEKRFQERLHVPIVNVSVEPSTSDEKLQEAIINISTPEPNLPIVIQTIDKLKDNMEESEDDDEFGEGKRSKRKSVVTFNENVEKIIHLEDSSDINPDSDYEIYKL